MQIKELLDALDEIEERLDREYDRESPDLQYIRGLQDRRLTIISQIVRKLIQGERETIESR